VQVPFEGPASQAASLQGVERDLLDAVVRVAGRTGNYVPLPAVLNQLPEADWPEAHEALPRLLAQSPRLIDVADDHIAPTQRGTQVAAELALLSEFVAPEDMEPTPNTKLLRVRGNHNAAMEAYAELVGGRFIRSANERCNFCNHEECVFVRRGAQMLCQVCFGRDGRRPWRTK
jgi:hypothetical protein